MRIIINYWERQKIWKMLRKKILKEIIDLHWVKRIKVEKNIKVV